MSTEVKCTVSDCQYWAHGNYCAASAILVTHGTPTVQGTGERATSRGNDPWKLNATPIENIEDSYCYTFVGKGP